MTLMKAMMTSISEVMEIMFFIPVEPGGESVLKESGLSKGNLMLCQLTFSGDASGRLLLAADQELVAQMTENFMGEDSDSLSPEHLTGTLTETLNMTCGNALSKISSDVPFELGIPERIDLSAIDDEEIFSVIHTPDAILGIGLILD
jgi:CheY-specific phosphatase CheX